MQEIIAYKLDKGREREIKCEQVETKGRNLFIYCFTFIFHCRPIQQCLIGKRWKIKVKQ
jgi:hypothetical protein